MEHFAVERGLAIQADNMRKWKSILIPEKFEELKKFIEGINKREMRSGYDVFRGIDIDIWIKNNLVDKSFPVDEQYYDVTVVRTSYSSRVISVRAKTFDEAKSIALGTAGNYEFIEERADYSAE